MGLFATTSKNTMLGALTVTYLSLHSSDPGTAGLVAELSGGSPAYARKAATFNAAASGERLLASDVTFDVPAGTVLYVGYWSAIAGLFIGSDIVTSETFGAQGQYIVKATTSKLALTD